MKTFVQPTPAPKPKTEAVKQISLFYAAFLVVMIVAQLFTFEKFLELIIAFNLPVSVVTVASLAPIIVTCELFALPFLLRMTVSPAFRFVSMVLGWLVSLLWLGITIWLVTSGSTVATVGFLGTAINLIPGWWAVFISVLFGIMAVWASWGMWPLRKTKR